MKYYKLARPIVVEASFDLDESVSLKTFEALNGSLEIAKMLLEYKAGSNGVAFAMGVVLVPKFKKLTWPF